MEPKSSGIKNFDTPIAALLGHTGVGKTRIYNELCNTQHATKYSKGSLTMEIRLNDVSHGNNKFQILDTPGNNAQEMPVQHAILIKEALT